MEINSNSPQTRLASQQARESASTLSSDFNTFLRMMTVQMQNQDPLNPLDSNDFSMQLATFSGVEQQVRTNDLLAALGSQMTVMGMSQLAGWVGMDALVAAPVDFTGTPVELAPYPSPHADSAELVVTDARGNEVQRLPIPVTAEAVAWAGTRSDGTPLPNGTYTFTVETFNGGDLTGWGPVESYSRITEARNQGGVVMLLLASGATVPASSVSGLRGAA